eukprot:g16906.t1
MQSRGAGTKTRVRLASTAFFALAPGASAVQVRHPSLVQGRAPAVETTSAVSNDSPPGIYAYDFPSQNWHYRPFSTAGEPAASHNLITSQYPDAASATHGQAGQDWLVQSLLGCKQDGVFVELGSHDAHALSNSLTLESAFGWKGLCLEADPQYEPGYRNRRCRLVQNIIGSPTGKRVEFAFHPPETNGLSGIVGDSFDNTDRNISPGTREAPTQVISLADVWRHFKLPNMIDYFSLDVEGAETFVMQDFPWKELRFKVLTVERPKPDLTRLLVQNGYKRVRSNASFGDDTYVDANSFSATFLQNFANGHAISSCMEKMGMGACNE